MSMFNRKLSFHKIYALCKPRVLNKIKDFQNDLSASVTVTLMLIFIVIIGFIALATDSSRLTDFRIQLKRATDAAALALATEEVLTLQTAQEKAKEIILANLNDSHLNRIKTVQVEINPNEIKVSCDTIINMGFSQVLGIKTKEVNWISTVSRSGDEDIEVVLVLDTTGSMAFKHIFRPLITHTKMIIQALHEESKKGTRFNKLKVGLVPFSTFVNVGKDNFYQKNLKVTSMEYQNWDGCVLARNIRRNLDILPILPNQSNRETLWRFPERPPQYVCPSPISPLTEDVQKTLEDVKKLRSMGTTNIPNGVSWGLRLLIDKYGTIFKNQRSTTPNRQKKQFMIILTDGRNEYKNNYGAYGYINQNQIPNVTAERQANQLMDDRLLRVCQIAKDEEVTIFTITYGLQPEDFKIKSILRQCASNNLYFNAPDSRTLESVFKSIVLEIYNIKITG